MDTRPPRLFARASALVDGLLRGTRGTGPARAPDEVVAPGPAIGLAVTLAAFYGVCMGLGVGPTTAMMNMAKIPLVLLLAALICLPSFYVFSALTGAPMRAVEAVRSLAASALFTSIVWAALAPVTGFFTVSTDPSSGFIAGLHGVVLALGLFVGAIFLGRELTRSPSPQEEVDGEGEPPPTPSARRRAAREERPEGAVSIGFFLVWLLVFGSVVSQLFVDFAPFLKEGPFVNPERRFFLDPGESGGGHR